MEPVVQQSSAGQETIAAILLAIGIHLLALTVMINGWQTWQTLPPDPPEMTVMEVAVVSDVTTPPTDTPKPDEIQAPDPTPAVTAPEPEPWLPPLPVVPDRPDAPVRPGVSDLNALADMTPEAPPAGLGGGSPGSARPSHSGRSGATRADLLRRHGGSAHTESAVELGLRWLASVQDLADPESQGYGRWSSESFMANYLPREPGEDPLDWYRRVRDEGPGYAMHDLGLTGLASLAYLGSGHTRNSGEFSRNLRAAIGYILRSQDDNGCFLSPQRRGSGGDMYDHAIALLALSDAYAMGDTELRPAIENGLKFLLKLQQPGGGWDYKCFPPQGQAPRNDLSISGFCIMAMASCRSAGLDVPRVAFERATTMIKRHTLRGGAGLYADAGTGAQRSTTSMTAVNLFLRRLLGQPADAETQQQVELVMRQMPKWPAQGVRPTDLSEDPYAWYYGALALMPDGGDNWAQYNLALKRALVEGQDTASGPRRGSWPPVTYYGNAGGGRVYSTAISVLCLQVYYRFLPEYLRDSNADFAGLWKE